MADRDLTPLRESLLGKSTGKPAATRVGAGRGTTAVLIVAFVATGISQPLLMSAIRLAGLGDTTCQLYMLPYFVGMACTGLLALHVRWRTLPLHRCVLISFVGIIGMNLTYAGNMLAGSGVFAVIYASCTVWNAVFARLLLQKALSPQQWAGILSVFLGLVMAQRDAWQSSHAVLQGAGLVAVGAVLHAASHVLSEYVSAAQAHGASVPAVPAQVNCCVQGLTACAVVGLWQLCYTAQHFQERIAGPCEEAGTSPAWGLALLGAVALGNFIHAAAFFRLLVVVGSVSLGVLKGVQAVFVFVLAHLLYCDGSGSTEDGGASESQSQSQCITPWKGASLLLVVIGVVGYALSASGRQQLTAKQRQAKRHDDNEGA